MKCNNKRKDARSFLLKRPVETLIPFEVRSYTKEDNGYLSNLISNCQERKVAVTGRLRHRMNNL